MRAIHPKTGKEVRIINTGVSLWKNAKTLSYSSQSTPWDSIWHSPLSDGSFPTYRVLISQTSYDTLRRISKESKVVLISRKTVSKDLVSKIKEGTLILLEEIHLLFPQLGNSWDGTIDDAVALFSNLLEYKRLFVDKDFKSSRIYPPIEKTIPPLFLITQYYIPEKTTRLNEINECLKCNIENPLISQIILLNESPTLPSFANVSKVKEEIIGHRITYLDVMKCISTLPKNAIVAFANADIAIDPLSWRSVWDINLKDTCLALLRYNVPQSGKLEDATIFGPRADSQDTWVVLAEDVQKRGDSAFINMEIPFGKMGCDNVFALEMLKQRYCVSNPACSLITWHFHASEIRTYDPTDVIDSTSFHYVKPTGLNEFNLCTNIKSYTKHHIPSTSLSRELHGSGVNKWMHSMANNTTTWKKDTKNDLIINEQNILYLENVYQTNMGMVYDSRNVYLGSSKDAEEYLSKYPIQMLVPTLHSERGFIVPWPVGAETSREIYILQYLSKVLKLRAISEWNTGDFFCPNKKEIESCLKVFRWGGPLPLIQYEADIQVWHDEAYVLPVQQVGTIYPDDIAALRNGLGQFWKESIEITENARSIVIVSDDTVLTKNFVNKLDDALLEHLKIFIVYEGSTIMERMLATFSGSWAVICGPSYKASAWNWMLPNGARVFQLNSKDDSGINVSCASGLKHIFTNESTVISDVLNELKL